MGVRTGGGEAITIVQERVFTLGEGQVIKSREAREAMGLSVPPPPPAQICLCACRRFVHENACSQVHVLVGEGESSDSPENRSEEVGSPGF